MRETALLVRSVSFLFLCRRSFALTRFPFFLSPVSRRPPQASFDPSFFLLLLSPLSFPF